MESQGGRSEFVSETNGIANLHTRINTNVELAPDDSTYIQLGRNKTGYVYGLANAAQGWNAGEITFRMRALNELDPIDVTVELLNSSFVTVATKTFSVTSPSWTDFEDTVAPVSGFACSSWPNTTMYLRVKVDAGGNGASSDRLKISAVDYQICDTGC